MRKAFLKIILLSQVIVTSQVYAEEGFEARGGGSCPRDNSYGLCAQKARSNMTSNASRQCEPGTAIRISEVKDSCAPSYRPGLNDCTAAAFFVCSESLNEDLDIQPQHAAGSQRAEYILCADFFSCEYPKRARNIFDGSATAMSPYYCGCF